MERIGQTSTTVVQEESKQPELIKFEVKKPKPQGGIRWAEDTIDNEHMNKKKSKSMHNFLFVKPFIISMLLIRKAVDTS